MDCVSLDNTTASRMTTAAAWDRDKIKNAARNYITEKLLVGEARSLSDDEPLIETGVVDSGAACELAIFFQEAFGIEIADAEIHEDNFDTVDRMARFVERKIFVGHEIAETSLS
jgi:acyl carrier protein